MSSRRWTSDEIRTGFARWLVEDPQRGQILDAEARAYVDYHAERYARLLAIVDHAGQAVRPAGQLTILDVGPNVQTALLREAHPTAVVDTLGFAHPAMGPRDHERHIEFDLNDLQFPLRRPALERRYDIVIMAEVVEHLYTRLATVLAGSAEWLNAGGVLIVQTPNGAALHKRLRLLLGRSPVEPPRASRENPGHFHEYTLAELREQISSAGLAITRLEVANYFGSSGAATRAYRDLGRVLPRTLRHGVTVCARVAS